MLFFAIEEIFNRSSYFSYYLLCICTLRTSVSVFLFCSRAGIIHVNSRFRRDVRTLDEEEELWFDQEDENGEETVTLEQTDLLNDDSAFKNRKTFVNAKPPPSIVNNKRVSISAASPVFYFTVCYL